MRRRQADVAPSLGERTDTVGASASASRIHTEVRTVAPCAAASFTSASTLVLIVGVSGHTTGETCYRRHDRVPR